MIAGQAASDIACAYNPLQWAVTCVDGPMGCFLDGWFDTLYPAGFTGFGAQSDLATLRSRLASADVHSQAAAALQLSIDADDAGLFGARRSIGDQMIPVGTWAGYSAREVAALGLQSSSTSQSLGRAAMDVLQVHDDCGDDQLVMPSPPADPVDSGDSGDSGGSDSGVVDTGPPAGPSDSGVVDTGTAPPDSGAVVDPVDPIDPVDPMDSTSDSSGGPAVSTGDTSATVGPDSGDGPPTDTGVPADSGDPAPSDSDVLDSGTEDTGG